MSQPTTEEIYQALFDLIITVPPPGAPNPATWGQTGRQLVMWDDVPESNQPAIFLVQGNEEASRQGRAFLSKWVWWASAWIYFRRSADPEAVAAMARNQFMEAMRNTMRGPIDGAAQTLGGRVVDARIDGTVSWDEGINDEQCVIVVPFAILPAIV